MKRLFPLLLLISIFSSLSANDSIAYNYDTIIPSYLSFEVGDSITRTQQRSIRRSLTAEQIIRKYIPFNEKITLTISDTIFDGNNNQHIRFEQYYNGIKIDGQKLTIHYIGKHSESLNGDFRSIKTLNTTPTIPENQALAAALQRINATEYAWQNDTAELMLREDLEDSLATYYPQGNLLIWFDSLNNPHLVYKFTILSLDPYGSYSAYVEAQDGSIAKIENCEKNSGAYIGVAATRFYGTQIITTDKVAGKYRLHDHTRGHIITRNMKGKKLQTSSPNYYDKDNNWTTNEYHANKDDAGITAHWAAEKTYDYFKNTFGRKGWNNKDGILRLYANASLTDDNGDNASWNGWGVTCGIGSSEPYVALDVIAHEIGHAITSKTADLEYKFESGALNEGFSDIWGVCVEHYAFPTKGDSIWKHRIDQKGGYRNIKEPKNSLYKSGLRTYYPNTYKGDYWLSGSKDHGGVHQNSTVFSHWFYILSEGKVGTNDNNDNFYVEGIGIDKAARIAYDVLNIYLTKNSTFADARFYSIKSAQNLYGINSPEAIAVQNAWYAVGIGLPYIEIVGPNFFCGGDEAEYSLQNLPHNFSSINWEDDGAVVDGYNDSTSAVYIQKVTIKKPSPRTPGIRHYFWGATTISANIMIGGENLRVSKKIEIHPNITPEIERDTTIALNTNLNQKFKVTNYEPEDSAHFVWEIKLSGKTLLRCTGLTASFKCLSAGNYTVSVENTDGCTPNNTAEMSFTIHKRAIRIRYRNPASYTAEISVLEQDESDATIGILANAEPYEGNYTLELWSEIYGLIHQIDCDTPTTQIPLNGLTPGSYFIKLIISNELITTQQLIVK
jgi:Zn-dependent metalloprotease